MLYQSVKMYMGTWPCRFALLFTLGFTLINVALFYNKSTNHFENSRAFFHPRCECFKGLYSPQFDPKVQSSCPSADFRGPKQKVLSYSFFGNTTTLYFKGVSENAASVALLYPNWTVRLYHNITSEDREGLKDLCNEVCRFPHLDECSVADLKGQIPNIEKVCPTFWRFLVMGDQTVEIFGVRDLDSSIFKREVDAVNDWLISGKTYHLMRDHPFHIAPIMAGMWGAKNSNMTAMRNYTIEMLTSYVDCTLKYADQLALMQTMWKRVRNDMVSHDSYLCWKFPNTRPWPTRRTQNNFVGSKTGMTIKEECALICRPKEHPDWVNC